MSISINVANIQPSTLLRKPALPKNLGKAASSIVDAFEAAPKVALPGGQTLNLPQGLPNEDAQAVGQLFSGIEPEALGQIESRTQAVIAETRASIRAGDSSGLSTISSGQAESSQAWLESIAPLQRTAGKSRVSSQADDLRNGQRHQRPRFFRRRGRC